MKKLKSAAMAAAAVLAVTPAMASEMYSTTDGTEAWSYGINPG